MRFNQRAATVLSYVSQFACPPVGCNMTDKEMWCVHKLLRMPAKCMSRKLCHSIAFCTEVDPISLTAYCFANMLRFANSEKDYLSELHNSVLINHSRGGPRLDGTPLASVNSPAFSNNLLDVPSGGISDPPILVSLIHAIKLSGIFSTFKDNCRIDRSRSWLVNYPTER